MKRISLNTPQIPYISNVTGDWIRAQQATDPNYWVQHIRQTVRFSQGIAKLLTEPEQVFLEVGPGRTLSTLVSGHPNGNVKQVILTSLRHPQESDSDVAFLLTTLGKLWLAGVRIDWSKFTADEHRHRLHLPTYPFERQSYWMYPPQPGDSNDITKQGNISQNTLQAGDTNDTNDITKQGNITKNTHSRPELANDYIAPCTPVEQKLAEIWTQVLGVERVSIHDNFFDLGGDSLQAVTLFAQIEKQFGKNLPLATLFQSGTVAEIAQIIRQKEWLAPWESLVAIQPNGNKPPLFYIHAGGGNLLVYRDLAYSLGIDQPVYGLQPRGLDGKYTPHTRIEDMADHYLAQIRMIQPHGPYFLAGLSSGGTTAWEIAQRLQAQEEKIALLSLFDTNGPEYPKLLPPIPRLLSVLNWAMFDFLTLKLVLKLKQLGIKQSTIKILDRLGIFKRVFDEDQKIQTENMQQDFRVLIAKYKSNSSNISPLEKWINSLAILLLKYSSSPFYANAFARGMSRNTFSDLPEALQQVQKASLKANRAYVPQVYPGRVILFRAKERPPGFCRDPQLGWGDLAAGGMEIYEIPGNHTSIMKSPVLAEKLRICLDKAQAKLM
ncbi:MAG: thioesterase domain-containing protein [Waterburya sp.]